MTDRKSLGADDRSATELLAKIRKAILAGVDWVEIRERDLPARDLLSLARRAVRAAARSPREVRILINDRVDVALAAQAAGVHLGSESLAVGDVLRWCRAGNAPRNWSIGSSCHTLEGAREAESAGASYIFFGPVFDTPSKRPFGPPQGVGKLGEVCRAVRIPVIAIGGVNGTNGGECLRAGAAGVAAIRLFQEPSAPVELMRTIEAFNSAE